jgi:hypothetical protein
VLETCAPIYCAEGQVIYRAVHRHFRQKSLIETAMQDARSFKGENAVGMLLSRAELLTAVALAALISVQDRQVSAASSSIEQMWILAFAYFAGPR